MTEEGLVSKAERVAKGERPTARKFNLLVDAVNRSTRTAPPTNVFRQGRRRTRPTCIPVTFATWQNLSLTSPVSTGTSAEYEGLDLSNAYETYGKVWVLAWQQTTASENGIYSYQPPDSSNPERTTAWQKEYDLTYEAIGDAEILVQHGKRWRGFSFVLSSENTVKIVIDRTVVVATASKESETLSGLGSLITGYDPTAGDLIFVRNQGLYIANTGTWKQVASLRTFASSEAGYGEIASQEISLQTVSSLTCSGTAITANVTTTYHELAVSPSHLYESGDL